jgi:hypothetical protein
VVNPQDGVEIGDFFEGVINQPVQDEMEQRFREFLEDDRDVTVQRFRDFLEDDLWLDELWNAFFPNK